MLINSLYSGTRRGSSQNPVRGTICHKGRALLSNEGTSYRHLWPKWHTLVPPRFLSTFHTPDSARNRLGNRTSPIPSSMEGDSKHLWPQMTTALACVGNAAKKRTRENIWGQRQMGGFWKLLEGVTFPLKWWVRGSAGMAWRGSPHRNLLGGLRKSRVAECG